MALGRAHVTVALMPGLVLCLGQSSLEGHEAGLVA